MLRDIDINEISDGKRYTKDDLVCMGCKVNILVTGVGLWVIGDLSIVQNCSIPSFRNLKCPKVKMSNH